MELHNSYTSSSSSRGINAGATIGYGHKIQTTGNGGSISASQSNQNTVETVYANGNFKNVNEVHNNTGSMVLNGFNQEGGKVTGNIGKVEVISRQNTSTTTGSSRGMSLGISANGVPSSVNISGSRTNGNRAFVDNQSTFIVGEGSSLHVGTLENTGAVVGKEGNSTFKIDSYVGKDIQNHDTMKTTGGSVGISTGKPRITNVGFNQDSRDKQGITRNTVVGDVEIGETSGSPINRDITRANEVTKDKQHSTNINVESQTIEYATNPAKLKEDIGKAKKEIADVKKAIKESINDRGDDNRNFFGQLREVRLSETVNNIAGKRLNEADKSEDVVAAWKDAYRDLGYNLDVRYTTGEDTPEMKDKAGTAYVSKDGVHTIIININAKENSTKAGLIGTLAEEASHIVNGVAGRQIATGTDEKGLESTGRATNAYFKEEYKGSNQNMTYKSDGKIDTSKLGTNVGDKLLLDTSVSLEEMEELLRYVQSKTQDTLELIDAKTKSKCTKGSGDNCEIKVVQKYKGKDTLTGTKMVREILDNPKRVFITNEKGNKRGDIRHGSHYNANTNTLTIVRNQEVTVLGKDLNTGEITTKKQNLNDTVGHELVHVHNDMKNFVRDEYISNFLKIGEQVFYDGDSKENIIDQRVSNMTGGVPWKNIQEISEMKKQIEEECKGKKDCNVENKLLTKLAEKGYSNLQGLSHINQIIKNGEAEKKRTENALKTCSTNLCVYREEAATSGIERFIWPKQLTNENILRQEMKNRLKELQDKGIVDKNIKPEDLNYERIFYYSPRKELIDFLKISKPNKENIIK